MHPFLVQDMENVKQKFCEKDVDYRKFPDIGDIDVELHIPGNYFDYDLAKGWKTNRKEDIIIRLCMSIKRYLDANQPKIEVFQPSQKEKFGIGIQMENIIRLLLGKALNTFSNSPDALLLIVTQVLNVCPAKMQDFWPWFMSTVISIWVHSMSFVCVR